MSDNHSQSHAHRHHHSHSHGHSHAPAQYDRAFAVGIVLNLGFVAVEAIYGLIAHSLSLLADAGHNLSDVAGLAMAWLATWLARRKPSQRFTYGFHRSSIMASLANAILLLIAVGVIVHEAIDRFSHPEPLSGRLMIIVATVGIAINAATAWFFFAGRKGDLNIRGAYLHMAADAAVSAGVVLTALLIGATGWLWLDSAMSLVIAAVITFGTWGLLRESLLMSLDGVPSHISQRQVSDWLQARAGVAEVHDLHIWAMGTSDVALTAHLLMPDGHPGGHFLANIGQGLEQEFGIGHSTLQIETDATAPCKLAPADTV